MPEVSALRPDDPQRVGRYRLSGRVTGAARDDSGPDVFLAQQEEGETVLITLLGADRAADPAARDRLAVEARTARRISPFCAARVLDLDFEGTDPFLVTEYVAGPTLLELVDGQGPLPPEMVTALAIGAATGLAAIHQTGLVHGQFGPGHLVMSSDGPRVTHASVTPPYGPATPSADLLAWARTVLFAAAGTMSADPADLAWMSAEVRETVALCLEEEPADRPTAREALVKLLNGQDAGAGLLAEGARLAETAALAPDWADGAAPPARGGGRLARGRGRLAGGGERSRRNGGREARPPRTSPARGGGSRRQKVLWWTAAGVAAVIAVVGLLTLPGSRKPAVAAGEASRRPRSVAAPAGFAGTWSGVVHQRNPVLSVTVRLTLGAGTSGGTISYRALGCSGRLTVAAAAPTRLSVRQQITDGRRDCEDGVITLVPAADGAIRFTFGRTGRARPTGVLARTGA